MDVWVIEIKLLEGHRMMSVLIPIRMWMDAKSKHLQSYSACTSFHILSI